MNNTDIDNNLNPVVEETTNDLANVERAAAEQRKRMLQYIKVGISVTVLIAIGFIFGYLAGKASAKTIPEAEVIVETTECTTAPEHIDILPETTETIHTEATVETAPVTTTVSPSEQATATKPSSEAPSAPVSDENQDNEGMSELEMLACVIYQEAGGNGSCDNCRRYVADIVLNRVNDPRFPNTMHEVLTARSQYGRFHWTGIKWAERASNPGEADAVARAYRIAKEVLNGQHSELYDNGYIWQAGFKQGTDGFWCCGHFYGR